ncbi:hypothetical protein C7U60_01765 [Mesorhizobium plurifarium]|nr:hypothetical protein C7U60_01765 [Mesorhizobium plurifarium]
MAEKTRFRAADAALPDPCGSTGMRDGKVPELRIFGTETDARFSDSTKKPGGPGSCNFELT